MRHWTYKKDLQQSLRCWFRSLSSNLTIITDKAALRHQTKIPAFHNRSTTQFKPVILSHIGALIVVFSTM
jgi:hypothetical protein